jgi:hypothetical protein
MLVLDPAEACISAQNFITAPSGLYETKTYVRKLRPVGFFTINDLRSTH